MFARAWAMVPSVWPRLKCRSRARKTSAAKASEMTNSTRRFIRSSSSCGADGKRQLVAGQTSAGHIAIVLVEGLLRFPNQYDLGGKMRRNLVQRFSRAAKAFLCRHKRAAR